MSWKPTDKCRDCGERMALHDEHWRCRYEQDGWIQLVINTKDESKLPPIDHLVMGRRFKEVFPVRRVPKIPMWAGDVTWEWGIPKVGGGHLLVQGLTHYRELRSNERRMVDEDAYYISSSSYARK